MVCGKPETRENDQYNLLNPVLLIEVLSPSTNNYDRGLKFDRYKDIPSLKEYVLVDSVTVLVEVYLLNEQGLWEMKKYDNREDTVALSSISVEMNMTEIYEGTLMVE